MFRITVEKAFRDNSLLWQFSTNDIQSHITAVVDTKNADCSVKAKQSQL